MQIQNYEELKVQSRKNSLETFVLVLIRYIKTGPYWHRGNCSLDYQYLNDVAVILIKKEDKSFKLNFSFSDTLDAQKVYWKMVKNDQFNVVYHLTDSISRYEHQLIDTILYENLYPSLKGLQAEKRGLKILKEVVSSSTFNNILKYHKASKSEDRFGHYDAWLEIIDERILNKAESSIIKFDIKSYNLSTGHRRRIKSQIGDGSCIYLVRVYDRNTDFHVASCFESIIKQHFKEKFNIEFSQ